MKFNAFDQFSPSINDMKGLLFPFSFRKWLKLGLVSMLSGSGGGSGYNSTGNSNFTLPSNENTNRITGNAISSLEGTPWYYIVFPIVFAIFVLGLIFTYITSVFSFIFLEALDRKDVRIGESWKNNKYLGSSYFLFRIAMGLIVLGAIAVVSLPLTIPMMEQGFQSYFENFAAANFLYILPAIFILVLFFIALGIFASLVYNFSIVHMYYNKSPAWQSIKATFNKMKGNKLAIFVFLIARLVIGICISLIVAIGSIFLLLPFLLIAAPFFIMFYLLVQSAGWTIPIIAAIAIVGFLLVLIFIYAINVAALPLSSFARYFSIRNYHELMK